MYNFKYQPILRTLALTSLIVTGGILVSGCNTAMAVMKLTSGVIACVEKIDKEGDQAGGGGATRVPRMIDPGCARYEERIQ